ncbi:MAG: T9SS type A sorting domain-containing protein [Aureispira sp.]|nr:T9SS type A sorting domain-containing protein [Aureispira sp.]
MRFTLFLIILFPIIAMGQAPIEIDWANHFGSTTYDQSTHQVWNQQNLYVVGYFSDSIGIQTSNGAEDGFVVQYSSDGNLLWSSHFGGTGADRINNIAVDSIGNMYIAGQFQNKVYFGSDSIENINSGQEDLFLAHYGPNGTPKWVRSIQGNGYESALAITLSQDSLIYISGYYTGSLTFGNTTLVSKGNRDLFIAKYDTSGNILWAQSIGGPGPDETARLVTDGAGSVYVSGIIRDAIFLDNDTIYSQGHYDAFLAKYNSNGQLQWAKMVGSAVSDYCKSVVWDGYDKLYITGWFGKKGTFGSQQLSSRGEEDMFLTQFDTSGNILWTQQYGGVFDDRAYDIAIDDNREIYLVGTLDSIFNIGTDTFSNRHLNRPTNILLLHLDSTGQYKWGKSIGYVFNDFCFDVELGDSNAIYLTGNYQDSCYFDTALVISNGGYDVYVAKYKQPYNGNIAVQPIYSGGKELNMQVSPNPFSNQITITYDLPEDSPVQITLLDIHGRTIFQQLEDNIPKGHQQQQIRHLALENGLYLLRFETKDAIFVQKVVSMH